MAAKETTIIEKDHIRKPIEETEITISIELPNNKGLFHVKIPASAAIKVVGQIYGQIGEIGIVRRDSKEQSKKYCTDKKESTT